jgi:group I intron endonuclease
MGVIYCLTSPSGKKYIGQTKRSVERRLREHSKCSPGCVALNNAIEEYGFENFVCETLLIVNDAMLDFYEVKLIEMYDTVSPNGYNIRFGGSVNSKHCKESCERMRLAKLGNNNPNFGKPRSESCKRAISEAKSGSKHHFFGKSLSYDHKLHLSISHKGDSPLPMYLVKVKERPMHYTSGGYAVINHPILPNKYFTSKKISLEEKYASALAYLESCNMDAVQRLNGDGSEVNDHGLKL